MSDIVAGQESVGELTNNTCNSVTRGRVCVCDRGDIKLYLKYQENNKKDQKFLYIILLLLFF